MRSVWRGAISFGLIHIPVRLYAASRDRELKFRMLHKKDFSEIRYARICKEDGKEIPWEDIVKGYEYKEGDFVILSEEDFEKADLKKTKTIEVINFTEEDQIDPLYYEVPYYLEPEKGAANAYILLREALKKSKKVAVGNYVFRHHEHIGVIRPHENLLILNQLRYDDDLIKPTDLNIPTRESIPKNEISMALQFIDQLTKSFHPKDYKDTYTHKIKELIKQKAKGHKTHVKKEKVVKSPKVQNIMSLLKASLEKTSKKKRAA